MTPLIDFVNVRHRVVRAVNLDSDLGDPAVLSAYSAGEHVLDALRRIAISLQPGSRTRAWSITGPYGSGKSSFAHLLSSVLSRSDTDSFKQATQIVKTADAQLAETVSRERKRLGLNTTGVISAVVVAQREPVTKALIRALDRGASEFFSGPGRRPSIVKKLAELRSALSVGIDDVFGVIDRLSEHAPVLIVVDELGKNLEFAAGSEAEGDLYVLQRVAEKFSSAETFTGGILTLAHLAFEDYLEAAGDARRREWRKIHGRFDDIPFVASSAHGVNLVAGAIELAPPTSSMGSQMTKAAIAAEEMVKAAAPSKRLPSDITGDPLSTYPLHPLAAVILPSVAGSLGQHDRSLVAFMTSDAPHALPAFLAQATLEKGSTPFVRVSDLYDYFIEDGVASSVTGPLGERIREVKARIDSQKQLDDTELRVLKTIGLLNLVETSDHPVASATTIEAAVVGPEGSKEARLGIEAVLGRFTERSVITFRDFAGEYRIWEGSDFDFSGSIATARLRISEQDVNQELLMTLISEARPLRHAVARRHSQQTQTLRYFESQYATGLEDSPAASQQDSVGLIINILANEPAPKKLPATTQDGRPLVIIWSQRGDSLRKLALDFAAARSVLSASPELANDPVARREMEHRVGVLQNALADAIDVAIDPPAAVCAFGGKRSKVRSLSHFTRALSEICDERYPDTPIIRNEMVNRNELTSQGAKARRALLEAMFLREEEAKLGLTGFGPERAMYEAVLRYSGIHSERGGRWRFGPPPNDSGIVGAWNFLSELLDGATDQAIGVDVLYRRLTGPPYGMKIGVIPILLTAMLQHRAEDVFLYQDQSFQPVVEPAHVERLLKTPDRFSLKRAALVGVRATVFAQLEDVLGIERTSSETRRVRNQTTLGIVRPLVTFVNALPEYTWQTGTISETSQQVCQALLNAREPDELLFRALPVACDTPPINPDQSKKNETAAECYVVQLRESLRELSAAYPALLERVAQLLHAGFSTTGPRSNLREDLRSRSRRLLKHVIEPKLRAFLMTAADETLGYDDWIEALAMTLASKPPTSWSDHDALAFEATVADRARWFNRLEVLHLQMNGPAAAEFEARLVTVSAPDGEEAATLVSIDASTHKSVDDILDRSLAELEDRIGTSAPRALLGVLAERLVAGERVEAKADQPKKRAKQA